MHILLLTDSFYPCPRSAAQRLFSFAQTFSSSGSKVTVITSNRCRKKKSNTLSEEFSVYDLKCPRVMLYLSSITINPFLCLLYFFLSVMIILKDGVSAILSSVPNGETAIAGLFLSKIFKKPFTVDIRDLYPPPSSEFPFLYLHPPSNINEILIGFFNLMYKHADQIICVDTHLKDSLEKSGIRSSKISVITNGADTSIYRPSSIEQRQLTRSKQGLPSDRFIFVYAGSLAPHYAVSVAINGVKELLPKTKGFELLIISQSNYASYEKTVKQFELEDYVKFMGPLPVTETAEILSACDVGIVAHHGESPILPPSWKAAYGGKIFSYMSCGIPIIASGPTMGAIHKLISKHGIGLFIGTPNKRNFAMGFSYFLNHKDKVKEMGENARRTVEKNFDRRKLALKLVSLVDDLCSEA